MIQKEELNSSTIMLGDQYVATARSGTSERLMWSVKCLDTPLPLEPGDQDSLEQEVELHQFIDLNVLEEKLT